MQAVNDKCAQDGLRFLYYTLALLLQCIILPIPASRILGIFPVVSRSHFAMHQAVMKGLASRGHQVTVLSFMNESASLTANYTAVNLGELGSVKTYVDSISPEEAKTMYTGIRSYIEMLLLDAMEIDMCDAVYSHQYIRDLLEGKIQPPDLLIVESFHYSCYHSLAEKFDIPLINTLVPTFIHGVDYLIGNPEHPAYWPCATTDYVQTMSFHQRLINWLHYIIIYTVHHLKTVDKVLDLDKKYVGNEGATPDKLNRRTSLVFSNNHFSFLNRPSVPNNIEIGGIHIKEAKPLPSDIREFIEEAENGVIFMSFGTTIKMSALPKDKIDVLKRTFAQIPQRVLWRSDLVNITDPSPNVMIRNWFPQRDILEHKNVKAFISHGGISSVFEAMHTAKPVVGIPFLYDQYTNINILQEKGVSIRLDYDSLTGDVLYETLRKIIDDRRYYENMKKLSAVFKDRPMSPVDTVVYWTEYAIRQKGAPHLRVASADMPFYKFLLLDVIAFILISTLLTIWLAYYAVIKSFARGDLKLMSSTKKIQ